MESQRQHKIAKLLQRDLGDILQTELNGVVPGTMLTVTKVAISPDLSIARVYLSVFGSSNKQSAVKVIATHSRSIRGLLGKRVRHQLRVIPALQFFLDDSLDYIDNIDQLLKGES